jgi:magnesium transporter
MAKKKKIRKKPGSPPGTLVFTGEKKVEYPFITKAFYNQNVYEYGDLKGASIPKPSTEGTTWLDVRGLSDVELIENIGKEFQIHPLVLEDILNTGQRPKYEEFENGLFIICQSITASRNGRYEIQTEQVSFYIKADVIITFQENNEDLFESVKERLEMGRGRIRSSGANYLGYALLDNIVDNYFIALDQLEVELEELEMDILNNANQSTKDAIHHLKQESLQLRKYIGPLREAISRFSRSDHPLAPDFIKIYLNDVYDHTIQLMELIDTNRDLLNGLYDLFLSEISFRMNSVMQVLTVISTIFIPLTFLAGIYGMNFEYIPELGFRYGYFVFWAIILVLAGILLYFFRRKRWL